jgi:hypothetical protein
MPPPDPTNTTLAHQPLQAPYELAPLAQCSNTSGLGSTQPGIVRMGAVRCYL